MVEIFIRRPIATTLLALGLALAGFGAMLLLPVSPLPNIDIPTIVVQANMPGASPETMSTSVATPLERHLGAIAAVTEMTSRSSVGSTQVVLQFDISRDIDGAARDVQAAINAARADLPAALRSNPTYRKFNPSDFPIMILALTSKTLSPGQIYDQASNILQQRLSQVSGVGDVELNGASLPAIRIELNPRALFNYGIGLEDVRAAVSAANANSPKGTIEQGPQRLQVYANDSATEAADYKSLVIAYRNNAAVRLSDVADVSDSVENVRNLGTSNGQPAILVNVTKQPGANVISVVDNIRAIMPELQAALPAAINLEVINDPTVSIRNAVRDVEETLVLSTILVVVVVFFFLRNFRATLVPAVSVPLSLLGTFGMMYLLGFSLDNFSLMALIVSTGFVVDNTIVVLENVTRHLELGEDRMQAALKGAQEFFFTVVVHWVLIRKSGSEDPRVCLVLAGSCSSRASLDGGTRPRSDFPLSQTPGQRGSRRARKASQSMRTPKASSTRPQTRLMLMPSERLYMAVSEPVRCRRCRAGAPMRENMRPIGQRISRPIGVFLSCYQKMTLRTTQPEQDDARAPPGANTRPSSSSLSLGVSE